MRTLKLNGNRIGLVDGLERMQQLTRLDLNDNCVQSLDQLRALSLNTKLAHLALDGNPVSRAPQFRSQMYNLLPRLRLLNGSTRSSSASWNAKMEVPGRRLSACLDSQLATRAGKGRARRRAEV